MNKLALIAITSGSIVTLALAFDSPPPIPSGEISYDTLTFEETSGPVSSNTQSELPTSSDMDADWYSGNESWNQSPGSNGPVPLSEVSDESKRLELLLNMYTSNYTVRGMGVSNKMSDYGYSSIGAVYTLPNRNLFGWGIYHQLSGGVDIIWDNNNTLGKTPVIKGGYTLGKEIFPNLHLTLGYQIQHGGLEGYLARERRKCSQRLTQELKLALSFNDKQTGFFGASELGVGLQGLNGIYWDNNIGYRICDIIRGNRIGTDLELSIGFTYSSGYWTYNAHGVDAYRIRASFIPYTTSGTLGRESNIQIVPWAEFSVAGDNRNKINRAMHDYIIADTQFTVGCDLRFGF